MKTKFIIISAFLVCAFAVNQLFAQTNNYYGTSGALSDNVWSLVNGGSPGGTYASAIDTTGGAILNFNNATTTVTGGNVTVSGINVNADVSIDTIGGKIFSLRNRNLPINVASGYTFDAGTQAFTPNAPASITKNGNGVLAFIGGPFDGGFTMNAGTLIMRGLNAMGSIGPLIINGGTIASTTHRVLSGRYTSITIGGDFTFGATTGLSSSSANLTFDGATSLGESTRTITIGGTGTYTLGGVISGNTNVGLTVNSTAAGKLALNGANTYTGVTTINSGSTVRLGNASALGSVDGGTVVNSGANLDLYGTNYSNLEPLSINGTGIDSEGAISNRYSDTAIFAGPLTLAGNSSIAGGNGLIIINNMSAITGTGNITLTGAVGGIISSPIAITGNITKAGNGTWTLAGANTYSGSTTISTGTLALGASEVLPNTKTITLGTAILSTGATVGFTETAGRLLLNDNSTIALGTGSHTLAFEDSKAMSWVSGKTLTITGWSGSNAGGTAGRIFFGSNAAGLTSDQLAQITFSGFGQPAILLSTGELVPDIATAVDQASLKGIDVFVNGTSIVISGVTEESIVTVYNTNGQLIKSVIVGGINPSISLGNKGFYLVKVGVKVFKVVL